MRESLWSFPLGERENLGFISSCSLRLAARGEIQTAKQKKNQAASGNWRRWSREGQEFDGRRKENEGGEGILGEGMDPQFFPNIISKPRFPFPVGRFEPEDPKAGRSDNVQNKCSLGKV